MEEKYEIIKHLGSGTFGCVYEAQDKRNGERVAIKKIKETYHESWKYCMETEVEALWRLDDHSNIIKLKDVIRDARDNTLFLVFEFMDNNLLQIIDKNNTEYTYNESQIKAWCFQVLSGLAHMHENGYFHRDLKPENLLVSKSMDTVKIADLGSVRNIFSNTPLADYVTTRWYRAPEVILGSRNYGPAVDMWAMGAILAELFTGRAIFPGKSSGDQIYKICSVLGSPKDWKEGFEMARLMNYKFPNVETPLCNISSVMARPSEDAIDLFKSLCSWDPSKRPTAAQALQHPFFNSYWIPRAVSLKLRYNAVSTKVNEPANLQGTYTSNYLDLTSGSSVLGPPPGFPPNPKRIPVPPSAIPSIWDTSLKQLLAI